MSSTCPGTHPVMGWGVGWSKLSREAAHLNHWATMKPPFILKDSYGPEVFGLGCGNGFLSVCVYERRRVNRVSVICATEASLIYRLSASGCRNLFLFAIFVCPLMLTGCSLLADIVFRNGGWKRRWSYTCRWCWRGCFTTVVPQRSVPEDGITCVYD